MDSGVAYLLRLDRAPSQPGGPLAPRVDDDELRAAEEALRNRNLARLRDSHYAMLQGLRRGELPTHEPFEEEEEPAPAPQPQEEQQQSSWQSSCVLS